MCTSDNRATEFQLTPPEKDSASSPDWTTWTQTNKEQTLPTLPFPPTQVFLPGESKQLHLFEARYLALFETTTRDFDNRCAHVLIDARRRAMAAVGTLLIVREWSRLDIGVCVRVDAVGRLRTERLNPSQPFLTADFTPFADNGVPKDDFDKLRQLDIRFWQAFRLMVDLALQLDIPVVREKEDLAALTIDAMQSKEDASFNSSPLPSVSQVAAACAHMAALKEAAQRVVGHGQVDWRAVDCLHDEDLRQRAYALSFAGWDFFPSNAQQRQKAIEERSTKARLQIVVEALELRVRELSARKAVQGALSK